MKAKPDILSNNDYANGVNVDISGVNMDLLAAGEKKMFFPYLDTNGIAGNEKYKVNEADHQIFVDRALVPALRRAVVGDDKESNYGIGFKEELLKMKQVKSALWPLL